VVVAAGVACAASGDDSSSPDADAGPAPVLTDAEAADAGHDVTEPKGPATCSDAGWCVTPLPDTDLTMIDIWPFEGRAFAVAQSGTLGVKVMEWIDAEHRWTYIDDETQNENGFGKYVGRIWAPNESEIYFTVDPGYIYHGTRGAAWTWERRRLAAPGSDAGSTGSDPAAPTSAESAAIGVWGTSANDIYAWHANTIFHWKSEDGGAPDWIVEYVMPDDNPGERVFVLSAGGSGPDDIWFAGGRGIDKDNSCSLVVRKTSEGYRRVFDGVFYFGPTGPTCDPQPMTPTFDGRKGAMTDVQTTSVGGVVALRYPDTIAHVALDGDGGYTAAPTIFPSLQTVGATPTRFNALWIHGDDAWLCGKGLILHGPLAGDAGAFGASTVALTGAPLGKELYRIRGANDNDLWAIGARYAFHKTTP